MKRKPILLSLVFLLAAALLAWGGTAYAQANGYALPWWTVDGGGASSTGPGYILSGTIGQADAGALQGPGYRLAGGFWSPAGAVEITYELYLPVVVR